MFAQILGALSITGLVVLGFVLSTLNGKKTF